MFKAILRHAMLSLITLLIVTILAGYFIFHLFAQQPLQLASNTQLFTVERGMSRNEIAKQIEAQQLVQHSQLLPIWIKLAPSANKIKAGTYQLTAGMTLNDLLQQLTNGKEAEFVIQFIEGTRATEWLSKLQQTPYLKHQLSGLTQAQIAQQLAIKGSLEGWLYPDSYRYTANSTDLALLKRAYQKMQQLLEQQWQSRDKNLPYRSPYEMLIMASIIEKETGRADERAKVASVFINRLAKGMRLQTDPTVIYGMGTRYNGNITYQDLREKTPYNTYVIEGLPPTPIAMPSKASLIAAAHPAKSDYLYFVADGQGGHVFTTNLQDHNRAVQAYLNSLRRHR